MSVSDIPQRKAAVSKKQRIRFSIDDNARMQPLAERKDNERDIVLGSVNLSNNCTRPRQQTPYLNDEQLLMLWHWGPAPISINPGIVFV
jgi:hypothetical protein